jgi:hypothetical protein
MFVDGNAESLYYTKEDSVYNGMNKTVSGRIKVLFEDNQISDIIPIRKPTGSYFPIEKVTEDIGILEGFIWKPKDRPRSKEEIIPGLAKKEEVAKPPAKPKAKTPTKKAAPIILKPAPLKKPKVLTTN